MPKPFLVILAIAAAVCAFLLVGPQLTAAKQAENFRLYSTRGHLVSLEDYRGKVVVLDFFASWCPPCRRAAPEIERLYETNTDRGVVVLGVNFQETADPLEYVDRMNIRYPVLVNGESVARDYGVSSIPTLLVIAPDGSIVFRESGWSQGVRSEMQDAIERALSQQSVN